MRREAFKLVNRGECTLQAALKQVVTDTELKESYFTTPLALLTAEGQTPHKFNKPNTKGAGDGWGFPNNHNYRNDFGYRKGGPKGRGGNGGKGKAKATPKGAMTVFHLPHILPMGESFASRSTLRAAEDNVDECMRVGCVDAMPTIQPENMNASRVPAKTAKRQKSDRHRRRSVVPVLRKASAS